MRWGKNWSLEGQRKKARRPRTAHVGLTGRAQQCANVQYDMECRGKKEKA